MKNAIIKFVYAILMLLMLPFVVMYGILDESYNRLELKQEGQNDKQGTTY